MFEYYKDFKFKNITSPKYRHLFWILFWPVYIALFIVTEKFVVPVYDVYSPIDDLIPFCEFFVIPYVIWYVYLAFSALYTLFFDIENFKKSHKFLTISCAVTFAIYIIFPNMQSLRPTEFARDNIFVDIMKNLYAIDTNSNVCPSIHVIFSIGMLFSLWNSKHFGTPAWRVFFTVLTVIISISTVFLKQHSVIDVAVGVLLSFLIFPFIFLKRKKQN